MTKKWFVFRAKSDSAQHGPDTSSETGTRPSLMHKMLAAQKRERQQIVAEMVQIKGFMPLLMKRRNGQRWSASDRAELTSQLKAMAHLSPYLVIMILPGSFLALPVLAWWLDRRRTHRLEESSGV